MLLNKLYRLFFLLPTLFLIACTQGPNPLTSNWGHMRGYGFGGGFMWLVFLVSVGIAFYFLLQNSKSIKSNGSTIETPLDILKKRYANGDIDKGEFDRIKRDLEEF